MVGDDEVRVSGGGGGDGDGDSNGGGESQQLFIVFNILYGHG